MVKLIYGIGINDKMYPTKANGKDTKEYSLWHRLLERCYDPKFQAKNPTYLGCQAGQNFKNYSYFYRWCQSQIGFGQRAFHLDKDLLLKGNKIYSEDTCLFVPKELNSLLTSTRAIRGSLPVGVCAHQGKFQAQCNTNNTSSRHIGIFKTPEEAFNAYKEAKEAFIKLQAEKWKPYIDPRAYATLMAYTVLITD